MLKNLFFVLLVFTSFQYPQNYLLQGEIGSFTGASCFDINASSGIFVVIENEIIKIDTLGKVLKKTGGYGWSTATFDEIPDIHANALQVIAADKNNDRIQIFDKDLNFLSEFRTHNYENEDNQFRYPQAAGISGIGDLYILDSENSRILKYNLGGEFLLGIGGYDAGEFQLTQPKDFVTDARGTIYVLDDENIVIFDQFGAGIQKIPVTGKYHRVRGYKSGLMLIANEQVLFLDLVDNKKVTENFEGIGIKDAKFNHGKLYILTSSCIKIYKSK